MIVFNYGRWMNSSRCNNGSVVYGKYLSSMRIPKNCNNLNINNFKPSIVLNKSCVHVPLTVDSYVLKRRHVQVKIDNPCVSSFRIQIRKFNSAVDGELRDLVDLTSRESKVIGNFQNVLQTMFPINHYKVTDKFDCFKNKALNQNQLILEANSFYGHTILIDTDDFVSVLPQIKAVMDSNGRGKSCIYVVRGSGTGKTVSMQLLQLAAMRDTKLNDTVALAFTYNHKTKPDADLSGDEAQLVAGMGSAPLGKGPRMAFALSAGNRLLSAVLDKELSTVVEAVRAHLDLLESSPEGDAELYLVACLRHIVDTLRAAGVVVERLLISVDEIVAAEEAVEKRFGYQGVVALHKIMTHGTAEEEQAAKTQILTRWGPDTLQMLDLSPSMGEAEKEEQIKGFVKVPSTNASKILRGAVLDNCYNTNYIYNTP